MTREPCDGLHFQQEPARGENRYTSILSPCTFPSLFLLPGLATPAGSFVQARFEAQGL